MIFAVRILILPLLYFCSSQSSFLNYHKSINKVENLFSNSFWRFGNSIWQKCDTWDTTQSKRILFLTEYFTISSVHIFCWKHLLSYFWCRKIHILPFKSSVNSFLFPRYLKVIHVVSWILVEINTELHLVWQPLVWQWSADWLFGRL